MHAIHRLKVVAACKFRNEENIIFVEIRIFHDYLSSSNTFDELEHESARGAVRIPIASAPQLHDELTKLTFTCMHLTKFWMLFNKSITSQSLSSVQCSGLFYA
jgi:hypothetical protein